MYYVILYLSAIVLANFLILLYNPETVSIKWALVAETGISFFLIGFDLSLRDKLHDFWQNQHLWPKMMSLIIGGSIITILFNLDAIRIALASCSAFLLAGIMDAFVYNRLRRKRFLIRANGSNLCGAAMDSLVFPLAAFGLYPGIHWIILGQFLAKFFGGALWAYLINYFRDSSKDTIRVSD